MADVSMQGLNAYNNHSNFLDNHLAAKAAKTAVPTDAEQSAANQAAATGTNTEVKATETSVPDAAAKTTEESAATDTVTITEPENKTKNQSIAEILAEMTETLSKLGEDPDKDKSINEAVQGLQAELQKFVTGYNDALNFAKSYGSESLIKSASNMVSRTDTYGSALQGIGIGISSDNSLFSLGNLQSQTAGERKAIQSLFAGNYSYGAKTRDTLADMLKELNSGKTYTAGTYDPMNVTGVE